MSKGMKNILDVDKEQELLQGFLRVGLNTDDESVDDSGKKGARQRRSSLSRNGPPTARKDERRKSVKFVEGDVEKSGGAGRNRIEMELRAMRKKTEDQHMKKKKPKENFVDFYTDKDRAAAVSAGTYDIKQSLQIKQKQDRNDTLLIPDEADINSIIALGLKEMKNANPDNAMHCFTKALELNNADINALVSRSKCYLLLGEANKALKDAETALAVDKNNIRAIYQKAESLYFLGQFEQSLMFFHRGLRARPELDSFRLGVQKTQEAIENTIGTSKNSTTKALAKSKAKKSGQSTPKSQANSTRPRPKATREELERRNARRLLGELCVDKEYLENLLKHPNLVRADTNSENISIHAKDAVDFLKKRQEFWRQQRPCTALPNHKNLPVDALPGWF